jgi:MGT family glycosyltransferase
MATIGIVCAPLSGHLNPMLSLGTELVRRGHQVVVLNLLDAGPRVVAQGLAFEPLAAHELPVGYVPQQLSDLQTAGRLGALRVARRFCLDYTRAVLRDGSSAVRALGIDGLVVDQADFAGSSVAEATGIPFVTVANALPINREPGVPFALSSWQPSRGRLAELRDHCAWAVYDRLFLPVANLVNEHRRRWSLRPYTSDTEYFSPLAQLSQCPRAFDFERRALPAHWHELGPLRSEADLAPPFPFERLDGRPLLYASLGSLLGGRSELFAAIAEACAGLDVQLVIAHNHKLLPSEIERFAGAPLVVPYAPQRAVLARTALAITHCGLNTVLDALSLGVPMVAVPLAFEQPAIAARVDYRRLGVAISPGRVSSRALRRAVTQVLGDGRYRAAAGRLRDAMADLGGAPLAAAIIEQAIKTRRPVIAGGFPRASASHPAESWAN